VKRLAIWPMVLSSLLGAEQKAAPKRFTPPDDFFVEDPLLAKDEGCAKDYAKALTLSGLEQRKMVADLVVYKCADTVPGIFTVLITGGKVFDAGSQHIDMVSINCETVGMPSHSLEGHTISKHEIAQK
jgi:hypothetical protein